MKYLNLKEFIDYVDHKKGLQTLNMIKELLEYQINTNKYGLIFEFYNHFTYFVIEIDEEKKEIFISDFVKECYRTCKNCQTHFMFEEMFVCELCRIHYCSMDCFLIDKEFHKKCKKKELQFTEI